MTGIHIEGDYLIVSSSLFIIIVVEEKSQRAFCLAIAALIGEGIYNFGELVIIITLNL